jgi:exonuclease VII small subunit
VHVRFFFEEGSARIAALINDMMRTTSALKQAIAPLSGSRAAIENAFKAYGDCKQRIAGAKQKIESIERERATALSRKITPKPFDASGMNRLRAELKSLESRRDLIWQAVDSYFSGADKVLKKWLHAESEAGNKALILKYLESPHRAVTEDPKFRVREILAKALSKSEELQVDRRDILKTESLLSLLDEIGRLRTEDEQLTKQIDYVKQTVKSEEFLESQHRADVERARSVEKALAEQMRLEEALRGEISSYDEQSVQSRLRLEEELGKFLGMRLKLYDEVAVVP